MSEYLLTIGIPTKNRQMYAKAAVAQIYSLGDEIQIIVSDNSDDDSLKKDLDVFIDNDRVKYIYTDHLLSTVENYSLAVSYADGLYYCALGDDDGVLPNILSLVKWMKENNIDGVKPNRDLSYTWPDNGHNNGVLCVDSISGHCKHLDTKDAVIDLLRNGGQDYQKLDLIGSYHCIVSKKMMDEVYLRTGHYYSGCSPDIYSAVCLSLLDEKNVLFVDYPFTLPGGCPLSITYKGAKGNEVGEIQVVPFFKKYPNYKWDNRIPYYYTSQTVWAETMMHALCDMGREDLIETYFQDSRLINYMYWKNISHQDEIFAHLSERQVSLIDDTFSKTGGKKDRLYRILNAAVKLLKGSYFRKYGVSDIQNAVCITTNYLSRIKDKRPSFLRLT